MQIIIGRDAKTSQLNVIIGQQTLRLGAPGSVPQTVSRQHCRITVTEGGTYLVENLKAANITYINNVGVEKKSMRREDSLALGTDRYQVDTKAVFAAIDKAVPKTADIRPLSRVWEDHEEYIINQKIKSARFVAIASSMGFFTIGAMVYTFVFGGDGIVRNSLYCIAAVFVLLIFIKRWRDASRVPIEQKKINDKFRHDYSCPNCSHSFSMNYEELQKYDNCPFCKAKFIK